MYNNDNQNNVSSYSYNKKSINTKIIVIIIIALILIVVGIFLAFKHSFNSKDNDYNVNSSYSFFLSNEKGKYALFHEDGTRLTDFQYDYASDFINGAAVVRKDSSYGIIDPDGKMKIDFNKYNNISSSSGLYEVSDESHHRYLINSNNKIIYDLENTEVHTYTNSDFYLIIEDKDDNSYKVLNYKGDTLLNLSFDNSEEPITSANNQYVLISYNNENYLLNANTNKQIASFNSSVNYCLYYVYENENIISLSPCNHNIGNIKVVKDNKLYDLDESCESFYESDNNFLCNISSASYLLDENFNAIIDTNDKIFRDTDTYVAENRNDGVDFYDNGNIIKSVSCSRLVNTGYTSEDLYVLGTISSRECGTEAGIYEFYKTNGEKAFNKTFVSTENYDKNGYAIVSEDDINYYLMDNTGKQVGNLYERINLNGDYYSIVKDGKQGLMDKNGNEILSCNYNNISIFKYRDNNYARLKKLDNSYAIYDLETGKELLSSQNTIQLSEHYMYVQTTDNTKYYSYITGKMFHES